MYLLKCLSLHINVLYHLNINVEILPLIDYIGILAIYECIIYNLLIKESHELHS